MKMNKRLPLTAETRLTKVLAAARNYERFSSARILLTLSLYSAYMSKHTPDEYSKNSQELYKVMKKYRPNLVEYIMKLPAWRNRADASASEAE